MKKTLSILLTVIMIVTTISVLTIIPAVADPTTPVNLIVNGDGNGVDGKTTYTEEDAANSTYTGEIEKNAPVGWRDLSLQWANLDIRYPHTFSTPSGYYSNYSQTIVMTMNKGQSMVQDITLKAGKTYEINAKISAMPINSANSEQSTVSMFIDAKSQLEAATTPTGVDWVAVKAISFAPAAENSSVHAAGDFTDHKIIFSADDFARANNLTANNGEYHARLVFASTMHASRAMVDDVTMYEVIKISKTDGGYINRDSVKVGEEATITATPYYGNAFLGWYDGNNTLVSNEQSITDYFTKNLTAKFAVYNQIIDGSFESGTNMGFAQFTTSPRYSSVAINPTLVTPTGSTATKHGQYCLEINPDTSGNIDSLPLLLNLPLTVEKNKDYLFEYYIYNVDSSNSTGSSVFNTYFAPKVGAFAWNKSSCTLFDSYTFNFSCEADGISPNDNTWTGTASATTGWITVNSDSRIGVVKSGEWNRVRFLFNSGDSTDIFGNNDTGIINFQIGLQNGNRNLDIRLDNLFFGEVSTTISGLSAENGGTLVGEKSTSTPTPMYYKSTAGNAAFGENDRNTSYYPVMASEAQNVTAKAYYGNNFLGWYDGNNKVSDNATIKDDGTKNYVAKFTNANQIPDGNFEVGNGVAEWQAVENGGVFHIVPEIGMSGNGMTAYADGNSMMAAKMPVIVKKGSTYKLQFNMKINSYSTTTTPIFSLCVTNVNVGDSWNTVPKIARYSMTFESATDKSKQYSTAMNDVAGNAVPQVLFTDIANAIGTGWANVTVEITFGDDTTHIYKKDGTPITVENIFANSDTATVYLALGYNRDKASATYDNISFYEDVDLVSFSHKENVRPYRVGIGPVAVGNEYKFGVDTGASSVTVKHNGTTVNATDGVYTVTLADTNNVVITANNDSEYPEMGKDLAGNSLKEYNHELYTTPIWEGDTVYQENAAFRVDRDTIKLLYPISDIISVRSFDLQTYYVEGVDFEVTAEGALKLLPGSKIPVYAHTATNTEGNGWESDTEGVNISQFSAGSLYPCTLSITYKHTEKWADGYSGAKQTSVEDQLFDLFQKLRKGEDVHVVFYGDSMTSGWSASGGKTQVYKDDNATLDSSGHMMAPYTPNWMTMFIEGVKKIYPDANITWENLSLGGKTSSWGAANFDARYELLNNKDIDLLLIGFGINDCGGSVAKADFKANTESIISKLRAKCSDAAVLLYGGNCTNVDAKIYDKDTLLSYEEALVEIAAATENTAATSLTSIFFDVAKSKETTDLFDNNFNHANDFGCRIYAQTMLGAFAKKYTHTAATPAAPTAVESAIAKRSITLTPVAGNEYSMDGVNWQDSNVFTGLEPDTTYTFYQRVKRTDTVFESACSPVANIKTLAIIYTLGDVNNNGVIDSDDAVLILQKEAGLLSTDFTEEQTLAADIDKNGVIDFNDAQKVLNYTVGVIDALAN